MSKPKRPRTPPLPPAPPPVPTEIESGIESRRSVSRRRSRRQGSQSTILTNQQALSPATGGRTLKSRLG